jgi:hypothetical protein
MVAEMIHTKVTLRHCENMLKNILTKLVSSNNSSQAEANSTSTNKTLDELPIKDSQTLQKLEDRLQTDESYKNSLVRNNFLARHYIFL